MMIYYEIWEEGIIDLRSRRRVRTPVPAMLQIPEPGSRAPAWESNPRIWELVGSSRSGTGESPDVTEITPLM